MPVAVLFASFALPAVAAGAAVAAVALPLVIHLLSRQRFLVVPWAAMRFLQTTQKRHRRKIDHWLLLLLRTLVLLLPLLGMIAATPWAENIWQAVRVGSPETASNAPRTHHVFVIDASLSMTARAQDDTRFERTIAMARKAIQEGNAGDGYSIIILAGQTQSVVPGPATDTAKVLAELSTIKVTHGTADMTAGLAMVADTLARSPRQYPRRQVTFFTDLQRSAWAPVLVSGEKPAPETWKVIFARAEVACVDVARGETDNLAIVDWSLDDPLPFADSPALAKATIHNFGRTDRRQVRVEFLLARPGNLDAKPLPIEQRTIEILPAGERATLTFALEGAAKFRVGGTHILQVRIVEGDELPADDTRTMAVNVRESLPCLVVSGRTNSVDGGRNRSDYLAEALNPTGKRVEGNPARPRIVSFAEWNDPTLADVTDVECVFLCDVPNLTSAHVARLESVLKRGGGVVVVLGPNAAANAANYNRILYDDGKGLLPGRILGATSSPDGNDAGYRLTGDEDSFRRPPMDAFKDDNTRGGLTSVPFKRFVKLDLPTDGRGRRILSFTPAGNSAPGQKPDPALVELPRHRGRVIVFTSTLDTTWNDWPLLPSFLPFAHELLRFAATGTDRHTLAVGDALEDMATAASVGLNATLTGPDGNVNKIPVLSSGDAGMIRETETRLSGIYRLTLSGRADRYFAVTIPEKSATGGSESDLKRIELADLRTLSPAIQVVANPEEVRVQGTDGSTVVTQPRAHGPTLARWLMALALAALVFEALYAWRIGPARSSSLTKDLTTDKRHSPRRWFRSLLALAPLAIGLFVLFIVFHAQVTGQVLGFLPESWRLKAEAAVGVPAASPGEGTRWRLEGTPPFLKAALKDQRLLTGLALVSILVVFWTYRLERRAVGPFRRVMVPLALRVTAILLCLFVFLPQLRLAFDREGWPDIAIILDTSASMGTVDELSDPAVRAKAEELRKSVSGSDGQRLHLAQALLTRPEVGWLNRLIEDRQFKVHIYTVADGTRLLTTMSEAGDLPEAIRQTKATTAIGPASQLGDGVGAVLKAFRGGSLAAAIVLTDGQTTAGEPLARAAQDAARANVPLYFVGIGDTRELPDLALVDLRADDSVMKNDQYVMEARLVARGPVPAGALPVVLYETTDGKKIERNRTMVRPDASGKPIPFRLSHTPTETGEKTYVIEVPAVTGETELMNNKIERVVMVTDTRKLKVLFVEGTPRYEFRYVKTLLERETEAVKGNKSIELSTLLLDAAPDYALQDKSAIRTFPTRSELFAYDVVILGDVDPITFPRPAQTFQDLADFAAIRGGGLLVIAGERATPHKLFDTPLADVLPIVRTGPAKLTSEDSPISDGYHPKLTPAGLGHPLFRFASDEVENAKIWANLKPLHWYSVGYKRKQSAEVLAVHPDRPGDDAGGHPLVLQQFVGAGRVVFLGFDETWRWRFRNDEDKFNLFWNQAVRVLARNRLARPEVRTDRQTPYRQSDPIRIVVRFPNDAPPPVTRKGVKVNVERTPPANADGTPAPVEAQMLRLEKMDDTGLAYAGTITRTPVGNYTLTLMDPITKGTKPRAEAKVLPPPGELDRLDMNKVELQQAAAESRGKFAMLDSADQLIDDLPDAERVPLNQPCPPIPVWNQLLSFGVFALLLASEWILRRRERLV